MTLGEAFRIAGSHGAMIGRHKPGTYYVTYSDASGVHEVYVRGKTLKCATDWILANLRPRTGADEAAASAAVAERFLRCAAIADAEAHAAHSANRRAA